MDALGPNLSHMILYMLEYHFSQTCTWDVFDDAFLTVHISGKGYITLIKALGIDMLLYKDKFDECFIE